MRRLLVALALACALAPLPAAAVWPPPEGADLTLRENQPSDPGYPGQWNLFSYIPPESPGVTDPAERAIGSGVHADRAWQLTIGDRRVLIAVHDSGIRWHERDLVNKFYLNRGELPPPDPACGAGGATDPYDVNEDGVFNVQDYTSATGHAQPDAATLGCDAAVSDQNANGFLDPQDLILLFSDGVDGDGNGYIDDISGWDAFHDDNDPGDDTDFGHGTGEAKDSGAETNNGMGDAGVCPECSILMVRVGDSFVVDAAEFALGVYFAVDSGAAVIQEALGSINNPRVAQTAIDYAVAQGVSVVASAADEDSFHHNMPGTNNHTIYVHATTHDSNDREDATTFLAFNNCTNYGAQLLLSTPGTGCSSEATGKTSGVVGLFYAAALAADLPPLDDGGYPTDPAGARRLHGEEVKQLLLTTVDDIYDPLDAEDPDKYPTRVGWEQRFGYGRTNARTAIDAILAGRIPPVVDLTAPAWFQVLYPDRTPSVDIEGTIRYRHALFDSYDYVVEWAPGIEPDDAFFTTIAEGTGETADQIDTTLATWDISDLTVENPDMPEPDAEINRHMVTLRIRVTLHGAAGVDGTRGEVRRAFHVVRDDTLLPGFPIDLGAGLEPSAKISDVDGDGKMWLVQLDTAGWLHVLDASGAEKPGWPQGLHLRAEVDPANPGNHLAAPAVTSGALAADTRSSAIAAPALGDLDGAGGAALDLVASSLDGYVHAWAADGSPLAGFPVRVDPERGLHGDPTNLVDVGFFAAPVLGDLDGDGDLEIVAAAYDGYVYVWHHDGTAAAGFPRLLQDGDQQRRIIATPALGDIDGDGLPEIVVGTNEDYQASGRLYAVKGDGSYAAGWPRRQATMEILPLVGQGLPNSPCMADTDDDGAVEVGAAGISLMPSVYDGDARELGVVNNADFTETASSDDSSMFVLVSNGTFADLDNDGDPELIWGGIGGRGLEAFSDSGTRVDFDHVLGAWKILKERPAAGYPSLEGFPRRVDDWQFFHDPSVADVDGDGLPEVINGSGGYWLRAWNHAGVSPAGWPKMTGQWIIGAPALGDLDGDGLLEVATGTRTGFLYAWKTTGRVDGRVDWASFHHDDRNTGNLEVALPFGRRTLPPADDGCGCHAGGRGGAGTATLLLLAFAALAVKRRR